MFCSLKIVYKLNCICTLIISPSLELQISSEKAFGLPKIQIAETAFGAVEHDIPMILWQFPRHANKMFD